MHVLIEVDTLQPGTTPRASIAAFRTYELRGHAVTPVPDTTTCAWTCWRRAVCSGFVHRWDLSWDLSAAAPGIVGLGPSRAPWGPLWGPIHRGRRAEGDGAERGASAATRPRLSRRTVDRHTRQGCGPAPAGRRATNKHADVPKTTQSGEISIHHYPLPYVRLIRVSISTEPQEAFPTEARSAARLACNRRTV
jgi:hypothetical protein